MIELMHHTLLILRYSVVNCTIYINRIMNLELISVYGTEAWKLSNNVLIRMLESARKQLIDLK